MSYSFDWPLILSSLGAAILVGPWVDDLRRSNLDASHGRAALFLILGLLWFEAIRFIFYPAGHAYGPGGALIAGVAAGGGMAATLFSTHFFFRPFLWRRPLSIGAGLSGLTAGAAFLAALDPTATLLHGLFSILFSTVADTISQLLHYLDNAGESALNLLPWSVLEIKRFAWPVLWNSGLATSLVLCIFFVRRHLLGRALISGALAGYCLVGSINTVPLAWTVAAAVEGRTVPLRVIFGMMAFPLTVALLVGYAVIVRAVRVEDLLVRAEETDYWSAEWRTRYVAANRRRILEGGTTTQRRRLRQRRAWTGILPLFAFVFMGERWATVAWCLREERDEPYRQLEIARGRAEDGW